MGFRVRLLAPEDPPDAFPDPRRAGIALGYPDGLIAIGGDLSQARLLAAYRRGIFPWYNDDQPILWWSPEPRAIIRVANFHMSRSLARSLRRDGWEFSLNTAFERVIDGCAASRGTHGTWITAEMRAAYVALHHAGYAHSVESWCDGVLAGGIYGIRLGRAFFGESMFSARSNGSKVALSALMGLSTAAGIELLDAQLESPHLQQFGLELLPRAEFLCLVERLTATATALPDWRHGRTPAAPLARLRQTDNG
ncbi:MAG: leucyl/phenylalanyl-tRNA--protein transferase [Gammaproteobacteria bacterium]|jgi:leucyl/phenylalanyl-tRNA--protein transferase|nr:leucyl/phenylalanyl-tRNA--protein transferase [Gammaproteobacteria bacterium]